MNIRYFDFTKFHGKRQTGSTTIRVDQLIKYWPEAEKYKYGQKADVLIWQKVYWLPDWHFQEHYNGGLQILDICDPDWLDNAYIKRTIDCMDAVVVPTKPLQEFIQQMTDKPIVIIKDRFDLDKAPKEPKQHEGKVKSAIWFGYSHNADLMQFAIRSLEARKIKLTVYSDNDPILWHYADSPEDFRKNLYQYRQYKETDFYNEMQKHDVCLMPKGFRPKDIFKSENRTVKAWLAGLPVAGNADELDALQDDKVRNKVVQLNYKKAIAEYDVVKSVKEYQELIDELKNNKPR